MNSETFTVSWSSMIYMEHINYIEQRKSCTPLRLTINIPTQFSVIRMESKIALPEHAWFQFINLVSVAIEVSAVDER